MNWIWSEHILKQMRERNISQEEIETSLNSPDEVKETSLKRQIYQKIINGKLLRVVIEENILVTAYFTDKIDKYVTKRGRK